MSVQFPGGHAPAASTEAPLEMLLACHHRIRHFCDLLQRLEAHVRDGKDARQAQEAATSILRFFNIAAVDHHADEEDDLFPALMESMAGSDPVCIREMIARLTHEHRQLDAAWATIEPELQRLERGERVLLSTDAVHAFAVAYDDHIRLEEEELLPMAERLLGQHDIDRIGRAMRLRRGIADDHPDL